MVRSVICLVLAAFAVVALGEDAGKAVCPGFVMATFTGQAFDAEGDIWSNVSAHEVFPSKIYTTELPEKTTVGYAAYMHMDAGVTYDFKGCYDDYVTVKVNDTWVLSKGGDCVERTGSYAVSQTGWYRVEFRVGNNGGVGGCQKAAQYGILWKKSSEANWRKVEDPGDGSLFCTRLDDWSQLKVNVPVPIVVSSKVRENDPTILDVEYIVIANQEFIDVRALAFEDGERSFLKVVRPETFIEGTDKCIGDGITANKAHKLSWRISADWKVDLAKCMFEILVSYQSKLPLDLIRIPATRNSPEMTVVYNSPTQEDVFNALLWYYADRDPTLRNDKGYLYSTRMSKTGDLLFKRADPIHLGFAAQFVYNKMGYDALSGELLSFVRNATRKPLWFNTSIQNAYKIINEMDATIPVGAKGYCVVDISEGAAVDQYPISYLDKCPVNGWSDEYKTTKILLRRIDRGSMANVTFTHPFYIGVFEITQKQYELITGKNPSSYRGSMRPVDSVSWNVIRGESSIYDWPTRKDVDQNSFVGLLQRKTGLLFDLPTEAQWRYARSAGTDDFNYNDGASKENDLDLIGRYALNTKDGRGGYEEHTTVGSYMPNAWGLYDMQGNVYEWCLDWHWDRTSDPINDPEGPESGSQRWLHGGRYKHWDWYCVSEYQDYQWPNQSDAWTGFRIALDVK